MFETQDTELALAVDLIAERIRALGELSPGSYAEFGKLTRVKEAVKVPLAQEIRQLLGDHQTVVQTAREAFHAAEKAASQARIGLDVA